MAYRGSLQVVQDLAEVATQVAQATFDNEFWEAPPRPISPLSALLAASASTSSTAPSILAPPSKPAALKPPEEMRSKDDSGGGGLTMDAILSRLPTPARQKAPSAPAPMAAATVSSSSTASLAPPPLLPPAAVAQPVTPAPVAPAPTIPRAPEPWGLLDPGTPTSSASQKGYREWLQTRGQQAMQRSRARGTAPGSSPTVASTAIAPPPPPGAAPGVGLSSTDWTTPTPPPSSWPNSTPQVGWAPGVDLSGQQLQQVQPMYPPTQQAGHQAHFQQWYGGNSNSMPIGQASWDSQLPTMLPIASRDQAVLSLGSDCQSSLMPSPMGSSTGQSLAFWSACSGSPMSASESPAMSPQELMANFIGGGGFALDEQQIAQALREAAPCVYDD